MLQINKKNKGIRNKLINIVQVLLKNKNCFIVFSITYYKYTVNQFTEHTFEYKQIAMNCSYTHHFIKLKVKTYNIIAITGIIK